MTLYEVLGVEPSATKEEIQRAFRIAAMRTHPDREGGSAKQFQRVEEAGRILLDDAAREQYDLTGARPGEVTPEMRVKSMSRDIMVSMISKGASFHESIQEMKKLLDAEIKKNRELVSSLKSRAEKAARFALPRRRKEGSKLLEELQTQAITYLESEITRVQGDLDFMLLVMEHFDHYEIDHPAPKQDTGINAILSAMRGVHRRAQAPGTEYGG